jgi:hypothetical protein
MTVGRTLVLGIPVKARFARLTIAKAVAHVAQALGRVIFTGHALTVL